MIEHVVHLLVGGVLVGKSSQLPFSETEVVELVLEDDAAVVESVHDDQVGGFHLFLGEGDVLQVVFAFMRIVLGAVGDLLQRILHGCRLCQRVALLVGPLFRLCGIGHDGLIDTLPVVHVLTLSPLPLEGLLSLINGHGVVEVPGVIPSGIHRRKGRGIGLVVTVSDGVLLCQLRLSVGLRLTVAFFFFLFLQSLYHAVDGFVALFLREFCQHLQRVLQMDGLGEGHQLVEYLGAFVELFVVLAVLVEQSDGFAVTALGIAELLLGPIEVAQMKQEHTFLNTAAGGLFVTFFIGSYGSRRVFLHQVDITHGIIHLIQVFGILVGTGHSFQSADHLLGIAACHHFRHGDAGIEVQFVGWIHTHHMAKSLIGILPLSEGGIELSQQIVLACFLLAAHLVLDHFLQVGDSLGVATCMDIIVGIGVVPFLHGSPVERVALHFRYYVLGVIEPVLFDIAFGQPGTGLTVDGWLRAVEA